MNWYKISQLRGPYSLLETIIIQKEKGLALASMDYWELKEAKKLEKNNFILKVVKENKDGKYAAYIINPDKFKEMGWSNTLGLNP